MPILHRVVPAALLCLLAGASLPTAVNANVAPTFGEPAPLSAYGAMQWPQAASAKGRTVVLFTEDASPNDIVYAAQHTAASGWSPAEPLSDPSDDVSGDSVAVVADRDGNLTAVWRSQNRNMILSKTLLMGEPAWGVEKELTASGDSPSTADVVAMSDGSVVAGASVGSGGDYNVVFKRRAANGDAWEAAGSVAQGTEWAGTPSLATNARGDLLAAWDAVPTGGSDHQVRAARRDAGAPSWSATDAVLDSADSSNAQTIAPALAPDGAATVVAALPIPGTGGMLQIIRSASLDAGSLDWQQDADPLTESGNAGLLGQVVSDRDGDMVAIFQEMEPNADIASGDPDVQMAGILRMYESTRFNSRTRDADTGIWSPSEKPFGDRYGGGGELAVDQSYNIALSAMGAETLDASRAFTDGALPGHVSVVYRPDGNDDFTIGETAFTGVLSVAGGLPSRVALDDHGNAILLFLQATASGPARRVMVAIGDATEPEFTDISVPETGTTGQPVAFSASASDAISGLDGISWSFGDGGLGAGSATSHTFNAAGTYTVRVTATDNGGITRSESRTITISDAPGEEPDTTTDKPKVLAPVIEARLTGRNITLNVKVALKAGKKCDKKAGAVFATTAFGGKTHKVRLTLASVDGVCRGTGKITLKRKPSARTRLRVTVSGGPAKSRVITTRRA